VSCKQREVFHISEYQHHRHVQQRYCSLDETEEGFVPKQENSNLRLLATGLKVANFLQRESFYNVTTKYFFLFQKQGKSFTEVA